MTDLATAAVALAASGRRVFPCRADHKVPLTEHGFTDATADIDVVAAWWRRYPRANIGMPTGTGSVDVLDVDNHGPDANGFGALRRVRDAGLAAGAHRLVRTPRAGLHLYFRPSGNGSSVLRRHKLDCRADGGYVLVPPSVVNGRPYEVLEDRPDATGTLDWAAIKALLDPPRRLTPSLTRRTGDVSGLARWLSTVGVGGRNSGLFWACCRLVEAGAANLEALEPLIDVAVGIGLGRGEAEATAKSALKTYGAVA